MGKKKYEKAVESIQHQIDEHRLVKLKMAHEEDNAELAGYYIKEISRLEEQLRQKQSKLLTRDQRIKMNKDEGKK